MHIIPGTAAPAPPRRVRLLIVEAPELTDDQAADLDLRGGTLRVNPVVSEDEQLAALLDAVTYLWTGRAAFGHAPRHLKVVSA